MSDLDLPQGAAQPAPDPRSTRKARGPQPHAAHRVARILLACEPFLAETLDKVLAHHALSISPAGLDVRSVGDGLTCLRELEMQRPDLLVVEGLLDKLTGKEVVETWRSAHPGDDLPVLFLSTLFGADAPKLPGVVTVRLPFDNEDLVEDVAKALAAHA